jgi:hypothetical protein
MSLQNAWNSVKSVGLDVAESLTPVLKTSKFRETVRYSLQKSLWMHLNLYFMTYSYFSSMIFNSLILYQRECLPQMSSFALATISCRPVLLGNGVLGRMTSSNLIFQKTSSFLSQSQFPAIVAAKILSTTMLLRSLWTMRTAMEVI